MPAKDKNGIELKEGDYVKIVVPVRWVSDGEVWVFVNNTEVGIQSKNVEVVAYDAEKFPAGHGEPPDHVANLRNSYGIKSLLEQEYRGERSF